MTTIFRPFSLPRGVMVIRSCGLQLSLRQCTKFQNNLGQFVKILTMSHDHGRNPKFLDGQKVINLTLGHKI